MSPFTRTLVLGAAAAASLPLTALALGRFVGTESALALHAVAVAAVYLACLTAGVRRRVAIATVALVGGALAWASAGSLAGLLVLLGLLVAGIRSGWLFPCGTLRGLAVEAGVLAGALATAGFLYSLFAPGLVAAAVATWGAFVVQSFFFLVGDAEPRRATPGRDAFEQAAGELEKLLESRA